MNNFKQIAIISGKGGAGKTTFTANFAAFLKNSVIVDCDVDAPDMEILLNPEKCTSEEFMSSRTAVINSEKCISCGKCIDVCKFNAIKKKKSKIQVTQLNCEGCGFCSVVCPENAIALQLQPSGSFFTSRTKYGKMVHAKLNPGEDNSGKLVHRIRELAKNIADKDKSGYIVLDGPPGIGCPVMSTISGVDHVILVTEPSISGKNDFLRVSRLCSMQNIPCSVVINKADVNEQNSRQIQQYSMENNINYAGSIPFDKKIINSLLNKKILIDDHKDSSIAKKMKAIFSNIINKVNNN